MQSPFLLGEEGQEGGDRVGATTHQRGLGAVVKRSLPLARPGPRSGVLPPMPAPDSACAELDSVSRGGGDFNSDAASLPLACPGCRRDATARAEAAAAWTWGGGDGVR